ncbi:MAG: hypothetical protein RR201_02810 [Malacoplasma sp.]
MEQLKRNLLEERLNKSPKSLFLHDAEIQNLITYGEQLMIWYRLGPHDYCANMDVFKDVVNEDYKTSLIVRQAFEGVKIKIFDFSIEDIDVNVLRINDVLMIDKNTIRFEILGGVVHHESNATNPVVEFEFKSFKWEVFWEEKHKQWVTIEKVKKDSLL